MLLGFHPILGWITYLIVCFGAASRIYCPRCNELIPENVPTCRYCNYNFEANEGTT